MAKKQKDINDNKRRYLSADRKPRPNTVVINTHNTIEHELIKSIIVYILKKRGTETFCESHWKEPWSGIPDVFAPEYPYYVEVLQSETNEMLRKKTEGKYPPGVDQVAVRVADLLTDADRKLIKKLYKRLQEELP